jgi:hypothetical protein
MKKLTTLNLALFMGISVSMAQNNISVTGFAFAWPDTTTMNNTANFGVILTNFANVPYQDSMDLKIAVVDSAQGLMVVHTESYLQAFIPANDTAIMPISNLIFDAPEFAPGNNNVVIWPIYGDPTFNTLDSLHGDVFIINSNAITEYAEWEGYNDLTLYPNPAKNMLFIDNPLGEKPVERVSIYSINGRLVNTFNRVRQLNVEGLDAGLYIVEVDLGKDRIKRFKIIKGYPGNR